MQSTSRFIVNRAPSLLRKPGSPIAAALTPRRASRKASLFGIGVAVAAMSGVAGATDAPCSSTDAPVAIVTTLGCKFCKKAKEILKEQGVRYVEYDLGEDVETLGKVKSLTGKGTVPQIFVGGALLGGCDDLMAAVEAKQFPPSPLPPGPALPPIVAAAIGDPRSSTTTRLPLPLPEGFSQTEIDRLSDLVRQWRTSPGEGPPSSEHRVGSLQVGPLQLPLGGRMEPACFSGREFVEWAVGRGGQAKTKDEAVAFGRKLQAARLLSHVAQDADVARDVPLSDTATLFRLRGDAPPAEVGRPLNGHYTWTGTARPASQVSEDLRRRILRLYGEHLSSDGRQVDYGAIKESAEFGDYEDATAELQKVVLTGLSRDELTAFFINLYNALIIHATVRFGTPQGTGGRLAFFRGSQYIIGGHVYTSQDIEDGVLRGNSPGAASIGVLLGRPSLSGGPFPLGDPRLPLADAIRPADPRIHFALVCGAKSCPAIKVFSPSNLEAGLKSAAEAFCESEVSVDRAARTVQLSKIFGWYKFDFGKDDRERLSRIALFMSPGPQREALEALLAEGGAVTITYKEYDWTVNG